MDKPKGVSERAWAFALEMFPVRGPIRGNPLSDWHLENDRTSRLRLARAADAFAEDLREALGRYVEKSEAIHRYMTAEPPKADAMLAVMTEMSLDAGFRGHATLASYTPTEEA